MADPEIKAEPAAETVTLRMVRDVPAHPGGPVVADVHPDEVNAWSEQGWREEEAEGNKLVTEMTILQMRAYAKEKGITIGAEATTKDAILAVIQAAETEPKA